MILCWYAERKNCTEQNIVETKRIATAEVTEPHQTKEINIENGRKN